MYSWLNKIDATRRYSVKTDIERGRFTEAPKVQEIEASDPDPTASDGE